MGLEGLPEFTTARTKEQAFQDWLRAHTFTQEERQRVYEVALKANRILGIPDEPSVTREELQARMVRNGLDPMDRGFQRDLMMLRYGNCDES